MQDGLGAKAVEMRIADVGENDRHAKPRPHLTQLVRDLVKRRPLLGVDLQTQATRGGDIRQRNTAACHIVISYFCHILLSTYSQHNEPLSESM